MSAFAAPIVAWSGATDAEGLLVVAISYGTLPFDAGLPTTAGRLATTKEATS